MLGNIIKAITNFFGFKTCKKCEKRREYLNFKLPFLRYKLAKLSNQDALFLEYCIKTPIFVLTNSEKMRLARMYSRAFNLELYIPEKKSYSEFETMLKRLKKVKR